MKEIINLKLGVISKNAIKESFLKYITRDGWVVTEDGAYGDNEEDCTIHLDISEYLKKFRKDRKLSQTEMAWILGVTRPTYFSIENGCREITLKEYMILNNINLVNEKNELPITPKSDK